MRQEVAFLPAVIKAGTNNGRRQSARRHFRGSVRAACMRAFTGGRLYLRGEFPTLEDAAAHVGSCKPYVEAAITLIKSDDQQLIQRVMHGNVSILVAAESVKPLVMLLAGFAQASPGVKDVFFARTGCTADLGKKLVASMPAERTQAARRLGNPETIWNEMVLPLVTAAE
jgi:hypothetical protein